MPNDPISTTVTLEGDAGLLALLTQQHELMMLLATFGGALVLLMLETCWPLRPLPERPAARWITTRLGLWRALYCFMRGRRRGEHRCEQGHKQCCTG